MSQLDLRVIFAAAVAELEAHRVYQVLWDVLELRVGCLSLLPALILLLLLSADIITRRIHVRCLQVQTGPRDPTKTGLLLLVIKLFKVRMLETFLGGNSSFWIPP